MKHDEKKPRLGLLPATYFYMWPEVYELVKLFDRHQYDRLYLRAVTAVPSADAHLMDVMELGARKYEFDDWKDTRPAYRYRSAALRHFLDLEHYRSEGEWELRDPSDIDEQSGRPHFVHAAASVLILQWHYLEGNLCNVKQASETDPSNR